MCNEEIKEDDLFSINDEFDKVDIKKASDVGLPEFLTSKSLAFRKKKSYEKISDASVPSPFVNNYRDDSISSSGSGNVIIEENCSCPQVMVVDDNAFNMQVAEELVTLVFKAEPDKAFSGDEAFEKV